MSTAIDPAAVRAGRVRGRYFRENFAQGFDLVQVVPELVTNADAAIATPAATTGASCSRSARLTPVFLADWRRELRRLGVPGFPVWRHEVRCTDGGEGVEASIVERRLGALGVVPEQGGQRGLFGRGLRGVWLAQGGGRIEGVRRAHRGRATGAQSSRGSSRRSATTRSPRSTCATTPRPSRCAVRSASHAAARA